eukprot:scaffold168591_cov14-Tisochrysis_lutea.AAC.1
MESRPSRSPRVLKGINWLRACMHCLSCNDPVCSFSACRDVKQLLWLEVVARGKGTQVRELLLARAHRTADAPGKGHRADRPDVFPYANTPAAQHIFSSPCISCAEAAARAEQTASSPCTGSLACGPVRALLCHWIKCQ